MSAPTYYLLPNRLSDVIRLIVVLACDKQSFRTESGLEGMLRSKPLSADNWLTLAGEHPEFFRPNKENNKTVLLIRFIQKVDTHEGEVREVLSVDQTQKLVDQAIALHDKQLARYQQDSHKAPVIAAYIAAGAAVIVGIITWITSFYLNVEYKKDINTLKTEIKKIQQTKK